MNRNIRIVSFIVAAVMTFCGFEGMAQINGQMKLSYCKGKVATSSDIGSSGAGIVEAASFIPTSMISNYRDLRVVGIKAGLCSKLNIETLTVWVRESLNGQNLCECTVSKANGDIIRKGWNYLMPTQPYEASSQAGFYIGYTISQKGTSYPVSAVGQDHEGGLYVKTNDVWADRCKEGKGTLSIEAVIEAANLPKYDLAVTDIKTPLRVKDGVENLGKLAVSNEASMTISGFDIVYGIDGMEPQTVTISHEIPPCTEDTVAFSFTPNLDRRIRFLPMSVSIARLDDGEDEDCSNNTGQTQFDLMKYDFTKVPVLEEFTTERCSNCPRAASLVHSVLEGDRFNDGKDIAVCHHSGYHTDWLTNDADRDYLWLYGGGTYAPALMFDRAASPGASPIKGVYEAENISSALSERMSKPANVAIECKAVYKGSDNSVAIDVSGEFDWDFNMDNPRITVYLMENDIPAEHQNGADGDFIHQHVVRAYNEPWGVPCEIDTDGDFSYSWETSIDSSWKRDNMEVVAFVNSYDPEAYWNCSIENATSCKIDWESSVENINGSNSGDTVSTEWFTMDGLPCRNPIKSGIYIRIDILSDGTAKATKVLIP